MPGQQTPLFIIIVVKLGQSIKGFHILPSKNKNGASQSLHRSISFIPVTDQKVHDNVSPSPKGQ
jgi:hypothetical protein